MLFKNIPGLITEKQRLVKAVQDNHVAHGLLFESRPGGGGLAMALAFATYVNCENRGDEDACGVCSSCQKMNKLVHPDMHLVYPVATGTKVKENTTEALLPYWREYILSNSYPSVSDWLEFIGADNKQGNIAVEEARNILRKLALKAFEGEYKILLIWKPEMMSLAAANALLKILEEPAPKTLFLLVTDSVDRLLATIISRTQRVYIPNFTDTDVSNYLTSYLGEDNETKVRQITYLANGNLQLAKRLKEEGIDDRSSWFADWMRNCYKWDVVTLIKLADQFDIMPKEKSKALLEYSLQLFRDIFLHLNNTKALLRVTDSEQLFVTNFSRVLNNGNLPAMVEELSKALYHLERNVRAKMIFLDLSFTIAQLIKSK